jgi:peptide/nickel transport system ATP-binding protein
VPQAEGETRTRIRLTGEIPSHADPRSVCVFHTRCPRYIGDICKTDEPELEEVEPGHFWRCHYSVDELRELQRTAPPSRAPITNGEPEAEAEEPSD